MDINVTKLNESFCHIECDRGTAQEIQEYFSFLVPGHKFIPSFRNKMWDGYLRLAKILPNGNIEFPTGLLHQLEHFCSDRNYHFCYITENQKELSNEDISKFVTSLNIHSQNKKIELRDYQLEAIKVALSSRRKILISPTSCLDPKTMIDVELDQDMIDFLGI
jgi:hypothetical protein